MNKPFTNGVH